MAGDGGPDDGRNVPLYRMELAYVGTPFQGFQSQADGGAVQDHLERALATFLRHPVRVIGASRTDSGVHAEEQVASFRTEADYDERRWLGSLKGLLHPAIGVRSVRPVDPAFHPVYSARGKAYRYRLWLGTWVDPFCLPYCWHMSRPVDLALMASEAAAFVGEHDFTSFCAVDSSAKTRVRTIHAMEVDARLPLVDLWVVGSGFLKQMVRTMVGTLMAVATGSMPPGSVARLLEARDRRLAGETAPANGLTLVRVSYGDPLSVADLKRRAASSFTWGGWGGSTEKDSDCTPPPFAIP